MRFKRHFIACKGKVEAFLQTGDKEKDVFPIKEKSMVCDIFLQFIAR